MRKLWILALIFILCIGLCGCMPSNIPSETGPNNTGTSSVVITEETDPETTAEETVAESTAETEHSHTFAEATCEEPKTCTVCSKTTGSVAAHDYEDGECRWCGKVKSSSGGKNMVWIPTKGGKKYHNTKTCSNMDDPDHVTKEEAEDLGFTPCKKCYN